MALQPALEQVDHTSFAATVRDATEPVLVDFWAPWCGRCRLLAPTLADLASGQGTVKVVAVNTDEESGLAESLGVQGLPTLVLFDGGVEQLRLTGTITRASLSQALSPWLASTEAQRQQPES